MLIKAGVDISRLKRVIRKKLPVIAKVVQDVTGYELVITSTYEGTHSDGSLHYSDEAVDIRVGVKSMDVMYELKEELGPDYDVVLEHDHVHIEYDPK